MGKQTVGTVQLNVSVPPDMRQALAALARVNGRTFRGEVLHALQRHLARPPVIVADEHGEGEKAPAPSA